MPKRTPAPCPCPPTIPPGTSSTSTDQKDQADKPPFSIPPKKTTKEAERLISISPPKRDGSDGPSFPVDEDELLILKRIFGKHELFSGHNGKGRPDLRMGEILPNGKAHRHQAARILELMYPVYNSLIGVGPRFEGKGWINTMLDGDSTNLAPTNRQLAKASTRQSRNEYYAVWSLRIRIGALLEGRDPDEAMEEARARYNAEHGNDGDD